ncbi:hypothetical protein ABEF92_005203 [Exophiala dermatitidis]|uniref:Zn(2)-C6 fungal-type domain-containing protein n=1 Tax=Exophiala dermatitidis (strain ATCC 34100 / CBS 525.76 / NIH/UT8656) TaxID=858893 RepID=H6BRY5_EXODN|nr:uncharacterized protein HMPREF1120_02977 [Exophiala dermatitidis NIH/UT8656]EHY54813.1 hypothetical protein HMPREF1120_02977 [Exophiala dermatitidis NIH/UT8656]
MATTTCTQCRNRKIRCDTALPVCRSCKAKGLECTFFDVSCDAEIPRRELDALRRRAADLESELERKLEVTSARDPGVIFQNTNLGQAHSQYITHRRGLSRSTVSSELISFMRVITPHWMTFSFQPPRFVAKAKLQEVAASTWATDTLSSRFPEKKTSIAYGEKKQITLRALVKHWTEVVQPDFPLLTAEQLAWLEKVDVRSPDLEQSPRLRSVIAAGVYSVSAALVARDFNPDLEKLSKSYLHDLDSMQIPGSSSDDPEPLRAEILALLFKALHQFANPGEQNINLHVFITLICRRYTQYFGAKSHPARCQKDVAQLGLCLYILESTVCLQLGLPSALVLSLHGLHGVWPEAILQKQVHEIEFRTVNCSNQDLHALLNEANIHAKDRDLHHAHTRKCLALYRLALREASSALTASPYVPQYYGEVIIMAMAAREFLEETSLRNDQFMLFSMQLATEHVLQAAAILSAYLIMLSTTTTTTNMNQQPPGLSRTDAMLCLTQVSALLASFKLRWKSSSVYVRLWDALCELILSMTTR